MMSKIKYASDINGEYDLINNEGKRLIMYLIDKGNTESIKNAIDNNFEYTVLLNLKKLDIALHRTDILFDNNISFVYNETLIFTKLVSSIIRKKRSIASIDDLYDVEITICSKALLFIENIKEIIHYRIDKMVQSN